MAIQKIRLEQIHPTDNIYNNYNEQVLGQGVNYLERFTAEQDQTVFYLGRNYDNNASDNKLKVFLNGMLLNEDGDYQETSVNTITFLYPLEEGDIVRIRINSAGGTVTRSKHVHVEGEIPNEPINGVNKIFLMEYVPKVNTEMVFKNGILMNYGGNNDYTVSGKIITFKTAPKTGDKVIFSYMF